MHSIREVNETEKQKGNVRHVREVMIESLDRHGILELAAILHSDVFPAPPSNDDGICVA